MSHVLDQQKESNISPEPNTGRSEDSSWKALQKVRQILVLPSQQSTLQETVNEQIKSFVAFLEAKVTDYREVLSQTSVCVFAVNYVQNRYVSTEFCVEIAKLYEILEVNHKSEFLSAIEELRKENCEALTELDSSIDHWDSFLKEIDSLVDERVGPKTKGPLDEDVPSLGVHSKTVAHLVNGTPFDMVLIVVVQSFHSQEVNQRILDLYKSMPDLHHMGCDVHLLTRGPPIGSRGGSYLKLIGVPFRRLYDENEAVEELKNHRRNAVQLAGWNALLTMVEISMTSDEGRNGRPCSGVKDDHAYYITQKGGTLLVDPSGNILFKYLEEEGSPWPTIEAITQQVQKNSKRKTPIPEKGEVTNSLNNTKVESEISNEEKPKEKKCCCIL